MSNVSVFTILDKLNDEKHYDKVFLTAKQTAELTGSTFSTLNTWRCTKVVDIPYIKIGKTVRYCLKDVIAWLDSKKIT